MSAPRAFDHGSFSYECAEGGSALRGRPVGAAGPTSPGGPTCSSAKGGACIPSNERLPVRHIAANRAALELNATQGVGV